MWKESSKLSNSLESPCPCSRPNNSRKGSKKRKNNKKRHFLTRFTMMSTDWKKNKSRKRIQQMWSARTSNKVSAKRERNASTHTISRSIGLKKSIFMSIRGLSWSWTQLEANSWAHYQSKNWASWSVKRKESTSKDADLTSFANFS